MRKPKDKDIIETKEGLLFSLVGYLHPPDSYTAYVKYRPEKGGRWEKDGVRYRRMMEAYSVEEMVDSTNWLRQKYPEYVSKCKVRNIELPLIPRNKVVRYYLPEIRLVELLGGPRDSLEKKTGQLATELADVSGVPVSLYGVTGSILTDMHDPLLSDINLLIFGAENAWKVRKAIEDFYQGDKLEHYRKKEIAEWQVRQTRILGIPKIYSKRLVWSRWRRGRIDGTPYSLNPVRIDSEITEEYGDETFTSLGSVEFTATVVNERYSLFLPARYLVNEITIHEGSSELSSITEVVSFEGIFAGVARKGDRIRVRGMAEAVQNTKGQLIRYQSVIGSPSVRGWLILVDAAD